MEDSSSNSDIKMIDISDEESFEFHFNNVFKQNESMPDSSDDEGIYKNPEHTKNTKKETGEVNKIKTEEKKLKCLYIESEVGKYSIIIHL